VKSDVGISSMYWTIYILIVRYYIFESGPRRAHSCEDTTDGSCVNTFGGRIPRSNLLTRRARGFNLEDTTYMAVVHIGFPYEDDNRRIIKRGPGHTICGVSGVQTGPSLFFITHL